MSKYIPPWKRPGYKYNVDTIEAYVEGRPTPDDSNFLTIVDSL